MKIMPKNTLDNFFNPQSIAIVGASNKQGKIGTVLVENLTKLGYKGAIYFVNPSYKLLKLKRCYNSLGDIKKPVDLAIIAVPAKFVVDTIEKSADAVKNYVVISAGFAEIGKEGAEREKQLLALAKKHGLHILGPNCLGFIVPRLKLNASFAGGMPKAGNIAFISQSGALAVALLDKTRGEHLGFSQVISVGNKMQLDEAVLLDYLAKDKETKVIGMYLEGIKNGQAFLEAAKKVSRFKPIVILKAGKTEKSQKAITSHTGALAGSDEIMDVAFASAGIIRAKDLEEFFDLLTLISFVDVPKNNQVAVVTNAGGAGVLTTDAFKGKNIALADFPEKTKNELKKNLPGESSVENPVDLLGDADENRYRDALALLNNKKVGSIISVLTPQQQTPVEKIAAEIINNKRSGGSAILAIFIGGDKVKKSIDCLKENGIPNFSNPDSAVNALDKYCVWSAFAAQKETAIEKTFSNDRKKIVADIFAKAFFEKRKALFFDEAANIMKQYGIGSPRYDIVLAGSAVPAVDYYPVALKIDSDTILHKSDQQALILNIKDSQQLAEAVEKLRGSFPNERLLIQAMQAKQVELILGIKQDAMFGPIIVFGLGGIYTEIFKMVDFLIPPMSALSVKEQVLKSKIGFLFQGVRGQKPCDIDEFTAIIKGLMDFALENSQVKEFDINPLFIYNDGRITGAADIKIML